MLILADGAQYQGEWNTATDQRHGRGFFVWSDGSILKAIGKMIKQMVEDG